MTSEWSLQRVSDDELADRAEELLASGFRLALVAAHDDGDRLRVVYLFLAGRPDRRVELEHVVSAGNPSLSSLAYLSFPAGRFEREMLDLYGIRPIGHPQPRRLVRHAHWPEAWHPMRADAVPAPEFAATGSLFGAALSVLSLATLAMIVSPGGLGAFPVAVQQVLLIYNVDNISFGWLMWGATTAIIIVAGIICFGLLIYQNKNKNEKNRYDTGTDFEPEEMSRR